MKLNRQNLQRLIKEELTKVLSEATGAKALPDLSVVASEIESAMEAQGYHVTSESMGDSEVVYLMGQEFGSPAADPAGAGPLIEITIKEGSAI